MYSDQSLPQQSRLRRHTDYALCYAQGRRYHTEHFLVFVRPREHGACLRMGMAVSRKVGKAVVRNRIKRLLREFYRLHQVLLPHESDVVIVAKKHAGGAGLCLGPVGRELEPLFRRLRRFPGQAGCPAC